MGMRRNIPALKKTGLYYRCNMINKTGQGEIITTVLLILLAIAALSIIAGFAIPFVNKQISGSGCIDIVNQLEIRNSDFTCYNSSAKNLSVQVHIGDARDKLSGFILGVSVSGNSKSYRINESSLPSGVFIKGSSSEKIPGKNEERTYIVSNIEMPDSIAVYALLKNGNSCDVSQTYNSVENC